MQSQLLAPEEEYDFYGVITAGGFHRRTFIGCGGGDIRLPDKYIALSKSRKYMINMYVFLFCHYLYKFKRLYLHFFYQLIY